MNSIIDDLFNKMVDSKSKSLYTFGYASLIWKPGFPYSKRIIGYIKSYKRRFYQGSIIHRGTDEWPGRVATLLRSEDLEEYVYGVAYKVSEPNDIRDALSHLAERELITGGYTFDKTTFYPLDGSEPFQICVYIANETNDQYLGGSLDDMEVEAYQIYKAVGECGNNIEYVSKVEKFMIEEVKIDLMKSDKYLYKLMQLIEGYQNGTLKPTEHVLKSVPILLKNINSHDIYQSLQTRLN